jgi:5-methyltetrahydropteroyltriglutamate--homocysteine methyltransferase
VITTVVGNYPKIGPGTKAPNLRTAISRLDRGEIAQEELHRVEGEVTKEIIEEQVRAGIDLVTDGQARWDDGQTYLASRIQGFTINGLRRYFDSNTYYRQPVAQGPLTWKEPITIRDFQFAVANSPRPVKPVLIGPYTLARLSRSEHHSSLAPMVMELAEALNQEALALARAGATIIQFDEPAILKHKGDYPLFQEAMGRLARGLTPTLALYTYFGDVAGLAPDFFRLPFQVLGLDFVTGPGNWKAVRDFPGEKALALGIMDSRNTKLETVEELVEAVRQARRAVPLDRLYLNPSCGLEFLPRETAYRKLVRLVEGAQKAREALT